MDADAIMKLRVFQCSLIGEGTGECAISWIATGRYFVSMIVFDCFLCRQDSLYRCEFNECGSILVCVKREPVS